MNRFCLAIDLKDDPALIEQYLEYHRAVWPEVLESLRVAGILSMEIYRVGLHLFMIIDTNETFSFERKAEIDRNSPVVQRWETLMNQFQEPLPGSTPWEKWKRGELIFSLIESEAALPR